MTLLATAAAALAAAMPSPAAQPTAPLTVTFSAEGEAAYYRWEFGDGRTGEGRVVEHRYAEPGRYAATLTTDAGSATVEAVAYRVSFGAPARAAFGTSGRFTGSIWPAVARAPVQLLGPAGVLARGTTRANGGFVLHAPVRGTGPFRARVAGLLSAEDRVPLRPAVDVRVAGTGFVGDPLRVVGAVRPAGAGRLSVTVWRDGRRLHAGPLDGPLALPTGSPASFRIRVDVAPAAGYLARARTIQAAVVPPSLTRGARGEGVRVLQRRLLELRYGLPAVDGVYGLTTAQAVLAFQKLEGLPASGRVDARTWRRLAAARPPRARHPGSHIEVSKGKQVLLVVRDGRVTHAVHVSTGRTGNTPLGHWRIYRRVTGWDWTLWYPLYFLRGFAIHGYPEVPTHPASAGCVRVPMWIAPKLFREHGLGRSVYIYW